MAGDWIKRDKALATKPEVVAMAAQLGIDRFSVAARCEEVWAWADEHTVDGHAPGVTQSFIDELACHAGFAEAMARVGWLKVSESEIAFPNFDRHNGESAKKRLQDAERQARRRSIRKKDVTQESRCDRDKNRDQRREEKRRDIDEASASSPRPRDSVWDAVCLAFGMDPQTRSERSRIGRIVRDLKLKLRDEEPAQAIQRRVKVHRQIWPKVNPVTPESLLKHWDTLSRDQSCNNAPVKLGVANAG